MLSDAPADASAHVSPGAPANVPSGASANVSISEPVVPSTRPRFIIPRRAVSAVNNNNEPGRAVPINEAGPAVPVNQAGPAVPVNQAINEPAVPNNNGPGPDLCEVGPSFSKI
ncbi:unc-89 protein [Lasius niger]|uniref:Unc-89 protein n=1 Tax=Lasius niger TaxID=67767 RepID=A0A0J7K8F3_LASNI|nr:unc-89 protein [Lasius niger]